MIISTMTFQSQCLFPCLFPNVSKVKDPMVQQENMTLVYLSPVMYTQYCWDLLQLTADISTEFIDHKTQKVQLLYWSEM